MGEVLTSLSPKQPVSEFDIKGLLQTKRVLTMEEKYSNPSS